MASSVQMDDVIPSTITLDLGTKQVSQDMDKAMVWDDSIESYRLMDKNLARVKVMLASLSSALLGNSCPCCGWGTGACHGGNHQSVGV